MNFGPTENELIQMRADAEGSMPSVALILPRNLVSDGRGGKRAEWADVGSELLVPIACRIAFQQGGAPSDMDMASGGRIDAAEKWLLTLPYGTEITESDRVQVDGVDLYEVVSILAARSYAVSVRVLVKRV